MMTLDDGTIRAEFRGPRFGWNAIPDRDGMWATVHPCQCYTCRHMDAHLSEPVRTVTWDDGVTREHMPARFLVGVS